MLNFYKLYQQPNHKEWVRNHKSPPPENITQTYLYDLFVQFKQASTVRLNQFWYSEANEDIELDDMQERQHRGNDNRNA